MGGWVTKEKHMNKNLTERFAVILALQKKQMRQVVGSFDYEVADKAIELALSENRNPDKFLKRNVERDAKKLVKEKLKSSKLVDYVPLEDEENFISLEERITDNLTPEHQLIYNQFLLQIRAICRDLHASAYDVLETMISGETTLNASKIIGISESLVKKLRVQIRQAVSSIINN